MTQAEARPTAVLVAVHLPEQTDEEHASSVAELGRLVHTLGYDVVATVSQKRGGLAAAAVLGEGKLADLAALTGGEGVPDSPVKKPVNKARARREAELAEAEPEVPEESDEESEGEEEGEGEEGEGTKRKALEPRPALVAVDHELTPSQVRNLERATGVAVLDHTGVIIEIFHRHARSREARLQVELARLAYLSPRLRESGVGKSERQAGKGSGETGLELDRRRIRDRMAELRHELEVVAREQSNRRAARRQLRRVALVGYTNAGKSSLMRALTGSDVLVEDKLFATLDTTVRALHPEVKPRIMVSDTVGFIKNLPHDLVASFRSTLDEALEASLLLYVVDASDATYEAQLAVTRGVLSELGADGAPSLLVLNKCDRLDDEQRAALHAKHPEALMLSARSESDVAGLRQHFLEFFDKDLEEGELLVPYDKQALVTEAHENARVLSQTYEENGVLLRLRAEPATFARLRRAL